MVGSLRQLQPFMCHRLFNKPTSCKNRFKRFKPKNGLLVLGDTHTSELEAKVPVVGRYVGTYYRIYLPYIGWGAWGLRSPRYKLVGRVLVPPARTSTRIARRGTYI